MSEPHPCRRPLYQTVCVTPLPGDRRELCITHDGKQGIAVVLTAEEARRLACALICAEPEGSPA